MAVKDPYAVLGVARNATPEEIKSAYRNLARQYHPDVNPDDPTAEDKFKEVGEAYSILGDSDRRARFDQYGTTEDAPGADFFNGGVGIDDLFGMFFGQGQGGVRRRVGRDGDDVEVHIEIELKDVLNNLKRDIAVDRYVECQSCHGKGTEGGVEPETCPNCRGTGAIGTVRNTFIGQVRTQAPCPNCRGEGTIIKNRCKTCNGQRQVRETTVISVNIPAGMEDHATIHLSGFGSEGVGDGRPGDLFVVVSVKPDPRFARRGVTLSTSLELTYAQAVLGDHVTINGIDGPVELAVAAGTQPGTILTVKGMGLPPLHGGRRGDLLVNATVKVPKSVTDAEVKLIRELAELQGEPLAHGEDRGGILGGLFGKKR